MDEKRISRRIQSQKEVPQIKFENEDAEEYEQLSSRSRRRKINLNEEDEEGYQQLSSTQIINETIPENELRGDYNSLGIGNFESDTQYNLDNDHMLGSVSISDYRSNILLEKTEEEDLFELEALIKKLNDCYKGSIETSSNSDYTEILMSYFKTNIRLSSLMLNSKGKNSVKFKKLIMSSTSNYQVDVKRSLSISSINEVDLRKIMSNILTSPHQKLKEHEQNTLLRSEIMTSNNIKTLISENIEADETIKILLTGETACRSGFIRTLQKFDQNLGKPQNQDEILGE